MSDVNNSISFDMSFEDYLKCINGEQNVGVKSTFTFINNGDNKDIRMTTPLPVIESITIKPK